MSLVIVTKQCFLLCDRIISIVLDEAHKEDTGDEDTQYKRQSWSFRKTAAKEKPSEWFIEIKYIPEITSIQGRQNGGAISQRDFCSLEIRLFDKDEAFKLYSEIVHEIREQMPDQLFLDKLVNSALTGEE
jgi:hypothetical protein